MPIRYRYALDEDGALVDVCDLDRELVRRKSVYTCAACGNQLIPKLGSIVSKHFAHHSPTAHCSHETYLHQLAKIVFRDEYIECLRTGSAFSLILEKAVTCDYFREEFGIVCNRAEKESFNLGEYFEIVEIEKGVDNYIADIKLSSTRHSKVILVEFAVSHRCEKEKIESGNRIIEIQLEEEADVAKLRNHVLDSTQSQIRIHNFRVPPAVKPLCQGHCKAKLLLFVVYESGKCILLERLPQSSRRKDFRGGIRHMEVIGKLMDCAESKQDLFRKKVREYHFNGKPLRNCFLCRYHGGDGIENAVFCKLKKESVCSNEAVSCMKFRPFHSVADCEKRDRENREFVERREMANFIDIMSGGPKITR